MKIIDLVNKMANCEEFPNKFKYQDKIFIYSGDDFSVNGERNEWFLSDYSIWGDYIHEFLNSEIEIIEEVEDKEYEDIEELDVEYDNDGKLSRTINALIRNQKKIIKQLGGKE